VERFQRSTETYLLELSLAFCRQEEVKQLGELLIGVPFSKARTFKIIKINTSPTAEILVEVCFREIAALL
jgi:hypothetical protein